MKTLLYFVKKQKGLVILSMILATINQVFSMLDPWVGRNILDKYLVKYSEYNQHDFLMGVGTWLLIGVGVAMVSRIAKNLQDYFLNVAIQKSGAEIFMEGVKHTLDLPYAMFEDTRSGETLNILQKVRTDTEKIHQYPLVYNGYVCLIYGHSGCKQQFTKPQGKIHTKEYCNRNLSIGGHHHREFAQY
jgi:ATP-binding cassette, subfamily B, bacterial